MLGLERNFIFIAYFCVLHRIGLHKQLKPEENEMNINKTEGQHVDTLQHLLCSDFVLFLDLANLLRIWGDTFKWKMDLHLYKVLVFRL